MEDIIDKRFIKLSLNCEKSRKVLEDLLKQFEIAPLKNERAANEWEMYNDNYAGAYFDEEGFLVFCTVGIDTLDVSKYDWQITHKKCKYSYRYLQTVQMIIVDSVMKPYGGICSVGVIIKENLVKIDVKDDSQADSLIENLIELLKSRGIYHDDAIKIHKTKGVNILF